MLKAVAAPHRSRVFRHVESGTQTHEFEEPTITISGDREEVEAIREVKIGTLTVGINPARRVAHHKDHDDPAIPFVRGGRWHLQIFLCGSDLSELGGTINIAGAGRRETVDLRHFEGQPVRLETRLRTEGGRWFIDVGGDGTVETLWQGSLWGREFEQDGPVVLGSGSIEIPALNSERLGLCLTTGDPYGGIEHKHVFFGEAGQPSGRIVAVSDRLLFPKLREQFRYRSLIVADDEENPEWVERILSANRHDEADIWCRPNRAEVIQRAFRNDPKVRVTTFTTLSDGGEGADVIVTDPSDRLPPDRPVSFLLFSDQNDPAFPERFSTVLRRIKSIPEEQPVLERGWLDGTSGPLSSDIASYGIGFSYSSDNDPRRAIDLTRRLRIPERSPCGGCDFAEECASIIATPWARGVMPGMSGCRVASALSEPRDQ